MDIGRIVVVVPCFNEIDRLDGPGFAPITGAGIEIFFVDDGSADGTAVALDEIAATLRGARVLRLGDNVGKAEAVRTGLREAIDRGASIIGYLDADLATPADEYLALLECIDTEGGYDVVLGSRVALLGHQIERRMWRHYAGRVFATGASLVLGLPVYDTQCGAKAFRVTHELEAALAEPFSSRWSFDVELIGRLARGGKGADPVPATAFIEVPLTTWRDQPGGKLGLAAAVRATTELPKIAWKIRHR